MTKVLNIDDIRNEVAPYSITVGGKSHDMKHPTVEDFIENLKDLDALAAAPSVIEETRATVRMIVRAFPSLTEAEVTGWPVKAIEKLFLIIRGVDPDALKGEEDDQGNPVAAS